MSANPTEPTTNGDGMARTESGTNDISHASEAKDSSVAAGDHSKAKNDTRDPADPHTNPESKETKAKENGDDSTTGTDTNTNPTKVDGPGPRPIADVAKKYGGDAGNAPSEGVDKRDGKEDKAAEAEEAEDEDGPQKTSHGEGTGEQYVKSSGVKAEGGDFDASAPGAGREADRKMTSPIVPIHIGINIGIDN